MASSNSTAAAKREYLVAIEASPLRPYYGSVLIFCDTRKACSQVADVVAKEYKKSIESQQRDVPWKRPGRVDCILVDKKLEPLIELGIAYHHAGLDSQDRRAVEQLFLDGKITVLCKHARSRGEWYFTHMPWSRCHFDSGRRRQSSCSDCESINDKCGMRCQIQISQVIIKGTSAWRNGRTEALSDTEILQVSG